MNGGIVTVDADSGHSERWQMIPKLTKLTKLIDSESLNNDNDNVFFLSMRQIDRN